MKTQNEGKTFEQRLDEASNDYATKTKEDLSSNWYITKDAFKDGAQYVLSNLSHVPEVRQLIEAAQKVSTINIEYQTDKTDGPFDMVYAKWKEERKLREDNLKAALAKFKGGL